MRLLIEFEPLMNARYEVINKHAIQGMIYSLLRNTIFDSLHDSNKFKYFTFSDIFPVSDFQPENTKKLIISSPNKQLIDVIYESISKRDTIKLKDFLFKIKNVKKFKINLTNQFISGSPIVLYKDNLSNEYFSFKRHNDLNFFLERLKDNAVKKYNAYTEENFELNENIFDRIIFKKEVVVKEFKGRSEFIIIGSVWNLLEKFYIQPQHRYFYEFILDCGLGEKNSLGFGFINPVK